PCAARPPPTTRSSGLTSSNPWPGSGRDGDPRRKRATCSRNSKKHERSTAGARLKLARHPRRDDRPGNDLLGSGASELSHNLHTSTHLRLSCVGLVVPHRPSG